MVTRLVAVEGLVIAYFDTHEGYNSVELGKYESHERALEVMEEINESSDMFYLYRMPKE